MRWTPTGGQIGRHIVAVKVTDSVGEFAYQGYSIEVVGAVTVPNVVGQTQASAQTILAGAGLAAGTIVTTASNTVPVGQVISQGIAAGTSVPAGAAVSLVHLLGTADSHGAQRRGTKPSRGPKRN